MRAMTTNIDIVRARYAASAQGNIEAMMVHVCAQVRWIEMAGFPWAGTWIGYRFELQSRIANQAT